MPVGRSRTVNRPASSVLVNWLRFAYEPPGSIHTPASGFPSGSTTIPLTETPGASVTVSATWGARLPRLEAEPVSCRRRQNPPS